MAYVQKIVMTKTGSNWEDESQASQELKSDISNIDYLTYLKSNVLFHETKDFNIESQTFTVTRTFDDESSFEAYETHVLSNHSNPKAVLQSKGWTVSTTFHTV